MDASVWISALVEEDVFHEPSRTWLAAWIGGGGRIIDPVLLLSEIGGAITRRSGSVLKGREAIAVVRRAAAVALVPVALVPIDDELGLDAARLAADLGLRGADAVYVAVARRRRVPLLTWDLEQLARAARVVAAQEPAIP